MYPNQNQPKHVRYLEGETELQIEREKDMREREIVHKEREAHSWESERETVYKEKERQ